MLTQRYSDVSVYGGRLVGEDTLPYVPAFDASAIDVRSIRHFMRNIHDERTFVAVLDLVVLGGVGCVGVGGVDVGSGGAAGSSASDDGVRTIYSPAGTFTEGSQSLKAMTALTAAARDGANPVTDIFFILNLFWGGARIVSQGAKLRYLTMNLPRLKTSSSFGSRGLAKSSSSAFPMCPEYDRGQGFIQSMKPEPVGSSHRKKPGKILTESRYG